MPPDRAAVTAAWRDATWAKWTLRTRDDVRRRQNRLWALMQPTIAATPAIKALAGRPLPDLPIIDARELRAAFAGWNTLGITADQAHAAADASEQGGAGEVAPGVTAGFSTGSEGVRGVFLASGGERARYIGHALAKLLPAQELLRSQRIALCLRADNQLYRDVSAGGRMQFRFFGLDMGAEDRAAAIETFAPHVLIAPAHVLAELAVSADQGVFHASHLRRLYWGAEPMAAGERTWITAALGRRPDPIYQATEGFLGAPCKHGVLHLNEDALVVELEPVVGTDRFRPIVTDLFRTTQPMIRVRLDDLIQPLAKPCACGSPLQAIAPVEGRVGDLWRFDNRVIYPREVERVLESALGASSMWQVTAGPARLVVETALPETDSVAMEALRALTAPARLDIGVQRLPDGAFMPKRRRVRWQG